ncbi:hypothetical protein P8C59_008525 [Phyllachora maydis]|uniref:EKC/KEOPS complex subunit BUD32 n=1 Tax=Phyllachora maydis TaxID=1825666 RepID=A0AAD9IBA0_9PEZI|nr:hypothetical protein P8C59_008525 [Phyllachora maydis]
MAEAQQVHPLKLPQVLTFPSSSAPSLVTQGAEGRLYKTTYLLPDLPCALKYLRCRRDGLPVPAVYCVDEAAGWLMMEWIDGAPVRQSINEWLARNLDGNMTPLLHLLHLMGEAVAKLHRTGIIHGDLTTSNMMLRPRPHEPNIALGGTVYLIDFGLATQGSSDEDRAVDLYVLERAFGSTHPRAEHLFSNVLDAYAHTFPQAGPVLRKLEDVRLRGRKRSMLG